MRERKVMVIKIVIALVVVALVIALYAAYRSSRAAYETAPYTVHRTEGEIQLRDYPDLVIVETPMRGADNSFMRLFRYIDGQNTAEQKIPMTTPVFMTGGTTNPAMSFVMPRDMARDQVPSPRDAAVGINVIPAGRYAVLRFGGRRRSASPAEARTRLLAWLQQEHLAPVGEPIYGYFDPPWTPGFLRRNEVMQRVAP